MKRIIHRFNARYLDDIYGVKAAIKNDVVSCMQTKYQVGLIYQHNIKVIMEDKLANDEDFRNDFMRGFIVQFTIPTEGNNGE